MSSFLPFLRSRPYSPHFPLMNLRVTQLRQHQKVTKPLHVIACSFSEKNYYNCFILPDSLHRFSKVCSVVFKCFSDYRVLPLEVWIKKKKQLGCNHVFFNLSLKLRKIQFILMDVTLVCTN